MTRVHVRRVQPTDSAALVEFYAGLSDESRYSRFLGVGQGVNDRSARSFCTPDHVHVEGFVAVEMDDAGVERIVGHLCLEPAGPRQLELAIAVADVRQGRGLGRRLMEVALAWAQKRGFEAILASACADNSRVLRLLSSAPFPVRTDSARGGLVEVVIPLARTRVERQLLLPCRLAT